MQFHNLAQDATITELFHCHGNTLFLFYSLNCSVKETPLLTKCGEN